MKNDEHPVGVFPGLSNSGYHVGPGRSKSGLDIIRRSPAHFKHAQETEREETAAFVLGSAGHGVMLEADQFEKEFALPFDASEWPDALDTTPQLKARLKELGQPVSGNKPDLIERLRETDPTVQILDDLKAMHAEDAAGKTILTPAQWRDVRGMRDAALEHPKLAKLLTDPRGKAEQSVYWIDEETGVLCRCRPDLWVSDIILDLKTTEDARPSVFERSVEKFRYYVQAAFYMDGIAAAEKQGGLPEGLQVPKHFLFGALEKKAPYLNGVYMLDAEAVEIGRREYREDLNTYAHCLSTGEWPGYGDQIQSISLPEWRLRQEHFLNEEE